MSVLVSSLSIPHQAEEIKHQLVSPRPPSLLQVLLRICQPQALPLREEGSQKAHLTKGDGPDPHRAQPIHVRVHDDAEVVRIGEVVAQIRGACRQDMRSGDAGIIGWQ